MAALSFVLACVLVGVCWSTVDDGLSLVQLRSSLLSFPREKAANGYLPLFQDVTSTAFPEEWRKWGHVGLPRRFCGAPVFPDWNNDGVLDFFYHNHFQLHPETDWDLGVSYGNNSGNGPWYRSVGQEVLVSTELPSSTYAAQPMDTHGTAILDIDRDGVVDMYMSVGGGRGYDSGPDKNAVLLWGTKKSDGSVTLVGGRDVSEKAGLENKDSRGRFAYFLDFNSDGLLDIVFSNDVRMDDVNAAGHALINQGNRKFSPDWNLTEYAFTMILTDADLDGHAEELVLQRRNCFPEAGNPKDAANIPKPTPARSKFCATRPKGTMAVYKYSNELGGIHMISAQSNQEVSMSQMITPQMRQDNSGSNDLDMDVDLDRHDLESDDPDMAWGMQTGDFDHDAKADLVVLRSTSLHFHYSRDRSPGSLPVGRPSEMIKWEWQECTGHGLRVADFDLDGALELLVMCRDPGKHRMYQRLNQKWELVPGGLGDLNDEASPAVKQELLKETCSQELSQSELFVQQMCKVYSGEKDAQPTMTYGFSMVDWDNDGYTDVVITHDIGNLLLLKNDWPNARNGGKHNRFLAIKLKGTVSNDYGIGATVLLRASGMGEHGNGTSTTQFREVSSASHETDWWGNRDDRIIFGLGPHGVPESVTVRWPGKGKQEQLISSRTVLAKHVGTMQYPLSIVEPALSKKAA